MAIVAGIGSTSAVGSTATGSTRTALQPPSAMASAQSPAAVSLVFLVGERYLHNKWPFTLSMCVACANNLRRPFSAG